MVPNANDKRTSLSRFAPAIAPLLIWCGLLVLLREVPPDGREHGSLGQFLGRFHILLVHGPLALLLLVPILELAGRRPQWAHFRAVAGPILSFAAFLTFATALDGWLLAWSGGYRGHVVTLHMWSGAWLAGICGFASLARCGALPRAAYPALLAAAVALTLWTGHTGGSITHGDDFLTEKLPPRMRAWLSMGEAASKAAVPAQGVPKVLRAGPASVDPANPAYYAVHIAPLMARSCVSCHKPEKRKGGLLMDTYEHLMRGGEDGAVVVPGNPKSSEILRRVRLPASDDDSMPSDGDKPFAPEEIQMIERWIAAGAKGGGAPDAAHATP
jgi:mono/diheme cytochrome c family protein